MKLFTRKFKSGVLHEEHVVANGMLGTVSAFAYRHSETENNMCRGGRSQDLPCTWCSRASFLVCFYGRP